MSNYLYYVDMFTLAHEECRQPKFGQGKLDDSVFCAHGVTRGLCYGDTGAPFVVTYGPGEHELVGISGWHEPWDGPWCLAAVPDVFTRVGFYTQWITNTTSRHYDD